MSDNIINNVKENIDALYQEYLKQMLDLVFSENQKKRSFSNKDKNSEKSSIPTLRVEHSGVLGDEYFFSGGGFKNETAYDYAEPFSDGYAKICKGNKYYFINTFGDVVNNIGYQDATSFSEGLAFIHKDKKWYIIDTSFKQINSVGFDFYHVRCFHNGYAVVKNGPNEYGFIDKNGNLINDIWYDYADDFHGSCAIVEKDGKYNYINTTGKLIFPSGFDEAFRFNEGFSKVRKYGVGYNFVNTDGNLFDKWYFNAYPFKNGYALVAQDEKYNIIDTSGKLISEEWYDKIFELKEGFFKVKNAPLGYNLMDTTGKLISSEWYEDISDFHNGYAMVWKKGKCSYIDKNGQLIAKWNSKIPILNGKYFYGPNYNILKRDLNGYTVSGVGFGYICKNSTDKFYVRYKPVKVYGTRYILCQSDNKNFMLFDKKNNVYEKVTIKSYEDNLLILGDKKYLIINDKKIDITEYYDKYLNGNNITTNHNYNVLTWDEFYLRNSDEVRICLEEEKKRVQGEKDKLEKENEQQRITNELKTAKELDELQRIEKARKRKESFAMLEKYLKQIQELDSELGTTTRVDIDNIFVEVGDHKEINPNYIPLLRYIDLSRFSFRNVKISGIDFSGTNIDLFPQTVYQKDLSGCNFEGIFIEPFRKFDGVNIKGTKFSHDDDPRTNDTGSFTFAEAIYDETTTFDGKPFTDIYGPCKANSNGNGQKS